MPFAKSGSNNPSQSLNTYNTSTNTIGYRNSNLNPNINMNNPNNNAAINDYQQSYQNDTYANIDQQQGKQISSNQNNVGNDYMGVNMNNNYNNPYNTNANYTPQTGDRLRMAGNNIFK